MMHVKFAMPGEPARKHLDTLQGRRESLLTDLEATLDSRLTPSEFRAAVVKGIQSTGAPTLALDARHMRRAGRQRDDEIQPSLNPDRPLTLRDIAWLIGTEDVADMITSNVDFGEGIALSDSDRAEKIAYLQSELEKVEFEEEREILLLIEAGTVPLRRGDADPAVLLRVWQEGYTPPAKPKKTAFEPCRRMVVEPGPTVSADAQDDDE